MSKKRILHTGRNIHALSMESKNEYNISRLHDATVFTQDGKTFVQFTVSWGKEFVKEINALEWWIQ